MPYTAKQRRLFHAKANDKSLSMQKRVQFASLADEADKMPVKKQVRKTTRKRTRHGR